MEKEGSLRLPAMDAVTLTMTYMNLSTWQSLPSPGTWAEVTHQKGILIKAVVKLKSSAEPMTAVLISLWQSGVSDCGLALYSATASGVIGAAVPIARYAFSASGRSRHDCDLTGLLGSSQPGTYYFVARSSSSCSVGFSGSYKPQGKFWKLQPLGFPMLPNGEAFEERLSAMPFSLSSTTFDAFSCSFAHELPLFRYQGALMDIGISLQYSPHRHASRPSSSEARGWKLSVQQFLIPSQGGYCLIDDANRLRRFERATGLQSNYYGETTPGHCLLEVLEDGFVITSPTGDSFAFRADGLLESASYLRGQSFATMRLGYTIDALTSISVEAGANISAQIATISRSSSQIAYSFGSGTDACSCSCLLSGGAITKVTDAGGREYSYSYPPSAGTGDPGLSCSYEGQTFSVAVQSAFGSSTNSLLARTFEGEDLVGLFGCDLSGGDFINLRWIRDGFHGMKHIAVGNDGASLWIRKLYNDTSIEGEVRHFQDDGTRKFSVSSSCVSCASAFYFENSETEISGPFEVGNTPVVVYATLRGEVPDRACLLFEARRVESPSSTDRILAVGAAQMAPLTPDPDPIEAHFPDGLGYQSWTPICIPIDSLSSLSASSLVKIRFQTAGSGTQSFQCRKLRLVRHGTPIEGRWSSLFSDGEMGPDTASFPLIWSISGAHALGGSCSGNVSFAYDDLLSTILFRKLRGIPVIFHREGTIYGAGITVSGGDPGNATLLLSDHVYSARTFFFSHDAEATYSAFVISDGVPTLTKTILRRGSVDPVVSVKELDSALLEVSRSSSWPRGWIAQHGTETLKTRTTRDSFGRETSSWSEMTMVIEGTNETPYSARSTWRSPVPSYSQSTGLLVSHTQTYLDASQSPKSISSTFSYDSVGRVIESGSVCPDSTRFSYDSYGRHSSASFGNQTAGWMKYSFSYSPFHALSQITHVSTGNVLDAASDFGGGPITSLSLEGWPTSGWTISFSADNEHDSSIGDNGSSFSVLSYENGLPKRITKDGVTKVAFEYLNRFDPDSSSVEPSPLLTALTDGNPSSGNRIEYEYDDYDSLCRVEENNFVLQMSSLFGLPAAEFPDDATLQGAPICYMKTETLSEGEDELESTAEFRSYAGTGFYQKNVDIDSHAFKYCARTDVPNHGTVDWLMIAAPGGSSIAVEHHKHLHADGQGDPVPGGSSGFNTSANLAGPVCSEDFMATGNVTLASFSYGYDGAGRLSSFASSWDPNNPVSYARDGFGRISSESGPMASGYGYDSRGNMTSRGVSGSLKTFAYELDMLVSEDGDSSLYAYNIYGYPSRYRGNQVTWDGPAMTGFGAVTMTYDWKGRRILKSTSGEGACSTTYRYVGNRLVDETITRAGSCYKIHYVHGPDCEIGFALYRGTSSDPEQYLYIRNALGDVMAIVGPSGTVVCHYVYDAYGHHRVLYGTSSTECTAWDAIGNLNPIRYRGYRYDRETGLYFLASRHYDPVAGRFISPDDPRNLTGLERGGANPYCYCLDDPLTYVDPTGHSAIVAILIAMGVGALASLVGQLTSDVIHGALTGNWEFSWQQYLGSGIGGALGGLLYATGVGGFVAGFVSAASATFVGNGLEMATGDREANWSRLAIDTFASGLIGGLGGAIIHVNALNRGSHSLHQIYKSALTKVWKYGWNISAKTMAKGFAMTYLMSFASILYNAAYSTAEDWGYIT